MVKKTQKGTLESLFLSFFDTEYAVLERMPLCLINIRLNNETRISEFYLLGLSDDPELQPTLFGLFLSMYLITVLGNLLIILAVTTDPHLHTPMYFFISILSWSDICFTSTTVPKMLVDIQTHSRARSFAGCLTQMSFFLFFGCMDDMLLTLMAYDRFVAICHPLHYPVLLNPHCCRILVLVSALFSFLDSQSHNILILQFTCFKSVEIPNYFRDASQIFKLSCSGSLTNNLFICYQNRKVNRDQKQIGLPGVAVGQIPTESRRHRAFSTCGAHLSVVCFFYGTLLVAYSGSTVFRGSKKFVVASVMHTVVSHMPNPFIYSLKSHSPDEVCNPNNSQPFLSEVISEIQDHNVHSKLREQSEEN
ncbi:olfactory receptor 7E178-like [Thomomys bottae]